jgi:DNA polymerase (family 10)
LRHGDKVVAAKTEADIYQKLGLQYIEPELREGREEIELARKHVIPKLVELQDLQGILHAHTNQSDGSNSIEEMAEATRNAAITILAWPTTPDPPIMPEA